MKKRNFSLLFRGFKCLFESIQRSKMTALLAVIVHVVTFQQPVFSQIPLSTSILTCDGDSTFIKASTNERFEGWKNEEGTTAGISNPDSMNTWVSSKSTARYIAHASKHTDNIVFNGNFEMGPIGFTSEYGNFMSEYNFNQYGIGRNPKLYSFSFISKGDHTSGNGNMFIAEGVYNPKQIVYRSKINFIEGKEYQLSVWVSNIHKEFSKPRPDTSLFSSAHLEFKIDSLNLGSILLPLDTAWHNYTVQWKATYSGLGNLIIRNKITEKQGNDFAFDDLSIQMLEPLESNAITVYPCNVMPVFSPDGDGLYDAYFIDQSGTAKIFDLAGNMIKQIVVPGHWDGSTTNGTLAESGYYAIVVNGHISHVSLVR